MSRSRSLFDVNDDNGPCASSDKGLLGISQLVSTLDDLNFELMELEPPNEPITPSGPQLSLPIATRVSTISREQLAHDLRLSIAGVSDGREASWYGPWALALQIMFMDFRARNVTCYTAAQMPVVRGYDPAVHDEIGQTVGNEQDLDTDPFLVVLDPEAGAESTVIDMSAWSTMEVPNTPEGPIWTERDAYPDDRMAIMLTGKNILSDSNGFVNDFGTPDTAPASPITPEQILRPPQPPNTQRTPSLTLSNKPSSIPKNIRSTRVPDFSQILKFFNIELTRLLCTRLLVIIEIKPPNKAGVDAGIRKATDQVIDQARHAFEADKTLEIIGCIIGVGRGWTYFDDYEVKETETRPITATQCEFFGMVSGGDPCSVFEAVFWGRGSFGVAGWVGEVGVGF
ncbi:hypothetical protein H0H93_013005 [Arthromyces matolae]|nr:hypothetical protein H0H93_013005 [Arthromyces matolae]